MYLLFAYKNDAVILAATCTLKGAISDIDIYYNKFELLQIIVNILTCLRFSCSTLGGLTDVEMFYNICVFMRVFQEKIFVWSAHVTTRSMSDHVRVNRTFLKFVASKMKIIIARILN